MGRGEGNACSRNYEVRVKTENWREITKVNQRKGNACFQNYEDVVIKSNCG
jgi:hypothetical protein